MAKKNELLLKPISEIISSIYNLTFLEIVKRGVAGHWWENRVGKGKLKVAENRWFDHEGSG